MEDIVEPKKIAEWLFQRNLDNPTNTGKGNMKLQKLLFFSQLIYMCKNNGETMYNEMFSAFDNGKVLEPIRQEYLKNYKQLKKDSDNIIVLPEKVEEALKITEEIFGGCTADELSELSHQFDAWFKYLNLSIEDNNYHNKNKAIVPYEELEKELYRMNKVLKAYEKRDLNSEEAVALKKRWQLFLLVNRC